MEESAKNIRIHPSLEKKGRPLIGVRGYNGPAGKGKICIHRSLSPMGQTIEIDESSIVDVASPSDSHDTAVFFLDPKSEITIGGRLTVSISDILLVAMSTSPQRSCSCGCSDSGNGMSAQAMRAPNVPGGGGPELPDLWCEIGCEQRLNSCSDGRSSGWSGMWCWVDYYICRLGCIYNDGSSSGTIFR